MGDRDTHELAQIIIDNEPDLMSRLRNCPTSRAPNIFHCDPDTNIWSNLPPAAARELIVSKLDTATLSAREVRRIGSGRDIAYLVAARVIDSSFVDRLDKNLDLFAVDNGVFDSSTGSVVFRAIHPNDLISKTKTAGWSYDPQMAAAHRHDVDRFLSTTLPDPAERQIFLRFVATLLSGRRRVLRFLMLSDTPESSGSGKTSLLRLLGEFFGTFGTYTSEVSKYFMRATHNRGRNGHSAELAALEGKRLICIDAVQRNMDVDEGTLGLVSGGATTVSGRRYNSNRGFEFDWQAGIIITCTAGNCPRRILEDRVLFGRMLVIPMRSKFVSGDLQDPNDVRIEHGIGAMFNDMRSALADVLVELYDNRDVAFSDDEIPISMVQMKESMA